MPSTFSDPVTGHGHVGGPRRVAGAVDQVLKIRELGGTVDDRLMYRREFFIDGDHAVAAARAAFDTGPWPSIAPAERAEVLTAAASGLRSRWPKPGCRVARSTWGPATG